MISGGCFLGLGIFREVGVGVGLKLTGNEI